MNAYAIHRWRRRRRRRQWLRRRLTFFTSSAPICARTGSSFNVPCTISPPPPLSTLAMTAFPTGRRDFNITISPAVKRCTPPRARIIYRPSRIGRAHVIHTPDKYLYKCTHTHTCTYTCTYTHIHTHICTRTHARIIYDRRTVRVYSSCVWFLNRWRYV